MKQAAIIALQNPLLTSKEKMILVAENQDDRLTILKSVQKHTFTHIFLEHQDDFFTTKFHYDWWMFPMHVPTEWAWQQRNYDASINLDEAKKLLTDDAFRIIYWKSIRGYITALEEHGWNDYPVRYARMLQSLDLFIQAAKEQGPELFYLKLCQQGQRALNFAEQNTFRTSYAYYNLLTNGLDIIQSKLDTQITSEITQECSPKLT